MRQELFSCSNVEEEKQPITMKFSPINVSFLSFTCFHKMCLYVIKLC